MDDPNLMQNTTSNSPDKKDNMTSVSPPKRTIVLGVVNTTGMKSTNINRKRRWDQPPEEISGPPTIKKLCISENETFPVNETESLEAASAVSSIDDRINAQCDNISGLSNQITPATLAENEEISMELSRSHSSDLLSEASAMSIDLPEEKSDKCKQPLCETTSDFKMCSDSIEKPSEVNVLESCDRLQCVETVNIPTTDSRFTASDVTLNKETASVTVSETKVVKHELKSNVSATVISHQSDELRRIMFSYDESSSDSDTMESGKEEGNANESISSSKIGENVISVRPSNIQPTGLETSSAACERVSLKDTDIISENDVSDVSPASAVKEPHSILPEYYSNETDAFIESSNSLENLGANEGSLIESQLNIPNKSEVNEITTDKEISCDSLANKILNVNKENVEIGTIDISSSIHDGCSIENSPPKVSPPHNVRHLGSDNHNLVENSVKNKIDLNEEIKSDQLVEPVRELGSVNNDIKTKVKHEEKSEIDNVSEELSSNHGYTEEKRENFPHETHQNHPTNEVPLKINNEEVETSEPFTKCDNGQLVPDDPSNYKLQLEHEVIHAEKLDIDISDDKNKGISSTERHASLSASLRTDILVNENSPEAKASQGSSITSSLGCLESDNFVKSEDVRSKILDEPKEPEKVVLSSESINQNHELVHCEGMEKIGATMVEVENPSIKETIIQDGPSNFHYSKIIVDDNLERNIRSEDSPSEITDIQTSDKTSSSLKFQSSSNEVHLNDSDNLICKTSQERDQNCVIIEENLEVADSLSEGDVNISMDVTPSDNIDPAVMEVILGSNEGIAIKEVVNDSSILSRSSKSDLKSNASEHIESVSTIINFEEKMDIVNETSEGQSEPEISIHDELKCSADTAKNYEVNKSIESDCLQSNTVIDNNSKLVGDNKNDDNSVRKVKEVINFEDSTPVENAVELNALNVTENDIGLDNYPVADSETVESYNTECKTDSEPPSNVSVPKMESISKTGKKIEELSIFDNTESTINTEKIPETNLNAMEIDELDSKSGRKNEQKTDTIEGSSTEISSLDVDQAELNLIENNDIEISAEETIETEISIEENIESEICSLESNEIVSVEANINSQNDVERNIDLESSSVNNVLTTGKYDNEINVAETNQVSTVRNDENVYSRSETEIENIYETPIATESNMGDISLSRGTLDLGLKLLEDESQTSEIENVSDSNQDILKELVVQEEITMEEDSAIEECVYDNNLTVRDDDIVLTSVDSPTYGGMLNPSPEESKVFEKSIDVSESTGDEIGTDSNMIIEPVLEETNTIPEEINSSKVIPPVEISSDLSYVEESILQDNSKTLTEDIEESFVVEEVVTCESLDSNKDADNEFGSVNEDTSSPSILFEETCETTESFVNNEVNAVIKENTVDSEVSAIDNQNEISNDSNLGFNEYGDSNIEKSLQKHISISKDLIDEPVNSIRSDSPLLDMECESSVNSITKSDSDIDMDIGELETKEKSSTGLKIDKIEVGRPPPSLLSIGTDLSTIAKDIGINVPLLTTVNNSSVSIKDKPSSTSIIDSNKSGSIPRIAPKLEPITLRIYKDNLSVKTDDLDSPKKNRSPKLSSELKSQLSPHIKSSDSSSLSPTTKKLEFTLKIAKDVNTNIPRATMSPKSSVSPSGIHKPGDILRAELTAESGRSSPAYMSSSESGLNKVKLKIPKPGLSKDYISQIQSSIKEETNVKDGVVDHSSGISLPKPSIEIGNVFKKLMETEKSVDYKAEINLDHSLNSPLLATPITIPVVRKRGRPRKILQKVLPGSDPNLNSSLIPGHSPFNHTPGLDISSGVDSSDHSSRQVRSCRARTKPIVVKTRKPRGGGARGGMRGRGAISSGMGGLVRNLAVEIDQEKLAGKLSEREKAELAKIEERKERQRQERHAKNEAKKAKKLARKLKDEERRLKKLREKAEKAEAAAPQVFEEETRMSAPDGGSRGHTPAPASALSRLNQTSEHYEESQNSISTPTSSQIKRGRMEIPIDPECKEVRVEHLAEYQWQGSELFMVQEQVSLYLGVKSFKRKYPDLKRRPVEAEERTFLEDSGLVPKSMCDLGLTAVSSAEILDIMYQDFPDKYEEFRKYVREKQAKEASFKQKAVFASLKQDKSKGEPREQALEAVAMWNSNLNRERREERRCALDLQTFTVHYPKQMRDRMSRPVPKAGLYPVSLIAGQFSDSFKVYTPTELMYFPLNTVMYGPLKPNERQPINPSDGSGSDSSSSSTSDDSSSSSSECESEDDSGATRECKICNGEKKTNRESHPEILLQCSNCKGLCHPTCQEITPEMLPHIKKYTWHCSNCKKCMMCKNTTKDDKMLFCDLCDRGYHIHCVGLKKAPEGRWHCSVCSFCTVCGSKDPGGPEWNYEYKKTDKGVRLYQRTLCVPCSKNALM